MTVAKLMENTLLSAERLWTQARARKVKPLHLNILEKVPRYPFTFIFFFILMKKLKNLLHSDIEIARAQTPKPVVQLAHEIGLLPDELESYGKYKAKVELSVLDRLAHRKNGKYIVISGYVLAFTLFGFLLSFLFGVCVELRRHPWEKANRRRPLALHRHWVHTLVVQHSHA